MRQSCHTPTTTVLHLAYRASAGEASAQKTFDFSRTSLAGRWEAGGRDMQAALRTLVAVPSQDDAASAGLAIYEVQG